MSSELSYPTTMKAIVHRAFGAPHDVLTFDEVPVPEIGDDDVLIQVRASSVNPYDLHFTTGLPYLTRIQAGWRTPRQSSLGSDVAGVVVSIGRLVSDFAPGDEVFGSSRRSGYAEFAVARADRLAHKPPEVSFEEAAAVPLAGYTALQALRDTGRLSEGQHVLINGASGGIGTLAVQIAKAYGARVTAVCSGRNVGMMSELGADEVIDYTAQDYTEAGPRFDLFVDLIGNRTVAENRSVLQPRGTYVLVGGPKHRWLGPVRYLLRALATSLWTSQRLVGLIAVESKDDMEVLANLMEAGTVRPHISRRYALSDTAEALRHLGTGHAAGKVVIVV